MSSLFSTVMKNIGGSVGSVVTSSLDKAASYLPTGVQNFLGTVGSATGLTTANIGKGVGDLIGRIGERGEDPRTQFGDLPTPGTISARSMRSQRLNAPGKAALMPLGSTERISKAIQDARVQNKLAKLGGFNIPTPNMRGGVTISLSSAAMPSASLSRKYTTTTTKVK